jgi:hypothetical protein
MRRGAGAGVEHVHRADVLELVGPRAGVRGERQERAVDDRVDALEDLDEATGDRRDREVDLHERELVAGDVRLPDVDSDDAVVAVVGGELSA